MDANANLGPESRAWVEELERTIAQLKVELARVASATAGQPRSMSVAVPDDVEQVWAEGDPELTDEPDEPVAVMPAAPSDIDVQTSLAFSALGAPTVGLSVSFIEPTGGISFDEDGEVIKGQSDDTEAFDVADWQVLLREYTDDGDDSNDPDWTIAATSDAQPIIVKGLAPNTGYQLMVRAVTTEAILGDTSEPYAFSTGSFTDAGLDKPTPPTLLTGKAVVEVTWDGNLLDGTGAPYDAPPQLAYVYAVISPTPDETTPEDQWTRVGTVIPAGGGSLAITQLNVGASYDIALVAVDNLGVESPASDTVSIIVLGIQGPDIEANSVTANNIAAGSLTVNEVSPDFGNQLDISANETVQIVVSNALGPMQEYYDFGPEGALISSPDSSFSLLIADDHIEIRQGGVPISYWSGDTALLISELHGKFVVDNITANTIELAYHQIQSDDTNQATIFKAITT